MWRSPAVQPLAVINDSFIAWRLGAGVQYTLSPKSDLGLAFEYLRADSSSDPSGLVSGSYDHPDMLFMSAHYAYRF
jgi:long-chain fatty acid transport protein